MLTPHCSAASGMVAPPSIASTTHLRKSSEYGFAIHTGLLPAGSLNHIRAGMGIPDSAFSGNALVSRPRNVATNATRDLCQCGPAQWQVNILIWQVGALFLPHRLTAILKSPSSKEAIHTLSYFRAVAFLADG